MLISLKQKIAVGKSKKITAYDFDEENEVHWLGYESGNIKRLHMGLGEQGRTEIKSNENLAGSGKERVALLQWNKRHQKLLSLDAAGLMVVWIEHKGSFVQEMINQSESNRIKLVSWSTSNSLIALVLEDNEVIMGTVEGERVWSLKVDVKVEFLQWLENDETLVLADRQGSLVAVEISSADIFGEFGILEENEDSQSEGK